MRRASIVIRLESIFWDFAFKISNKIRITWDIFTLNMHQAIAYRPILIQGLSVACMLRSRLFDSSHVELSITNSQQWLNHYSVLRLYDEIAYNAVIY